MSLVTIPAFTACSPDDSKTDIENPDNPTPEPNPEPEPDPEPSEPVTTTGYRWFELPAVNAENDGKGYFKDKSDADLYYAYHLCDGPEKYAHSGKRARNYTV